MAAVPKTKSARLRRVGVALGSVAAMAATLLVAAPAAQAAPPANDDFANRQVLAGFGQVTGSIAEATLEPNEPEHTGLPESQSIWYEYTVPATGPEAVGRLRIDLAGSDFDTMLLVYTGDGTDVGALDLVDLSDDEDTDGGIYTSLLDFDVTPGTTYYIAVDICCGTGSNVVLTLSEAQEVGSLEGFVRGPGDAPVGDVCVEVLDGSGDLVVPGTTTAPDGYYLFLGVPVGTHHLQFSNCGTANVAGEYYDDQQTLAAADDVVITEDGTTEADATLAAGGTITGTVTSDGDLPEGATLEDVCVLATMVGGSDDGFVRKTNTDADGDYTLTGLDGGDYRLQFGHNESGTCAAVNDALATEYYDDALEPEDADLVTVVEGSTVSGIDAAVLAAPGNIAGTVTSFATGLGLADMCVQATRPGFSSAVVDTAVDGTYTLANLPVSTQYVVRFTDCHAESDPYAQQFYNEELTLADADKVTVLARQTTGSIDARMFHLGSINGSALDENSNPRPNACVELADDGGTVLETAEAGADGTWSFTSIRPDDYTLRFYECGTGLSFDPLWWDSAVDFADATVVTVASGQTVTAIDQVLPGNGDGQITGTVTDDGDDPLEGICVAVDGGTEYTTETGADGSYALTGLPAGTTYHLEFANCDADDPLHNVLPQWYDDQPDLASADPVTVLAGSTTAGIDAQLHTAGSITGTVTDVAEAGIPDICVTVSTTEGDIVGDSSTDADGEYEVIALVTGDYLVDFSDCTYEYMPQWYDGVDQQEDATPVAVTVGAATTGVDAVLQRFGTISGTVTNEAGDPLPEICIFAYTPPPDSELAWFTGTGDDGTYLLGALDTGHYVLAFGSCDGPYGDEFYDNKLDLDTADLIEVTLGQDTPDIDAVLQDTAPVNTTPPSIGGAPSVGATLTANTGAWDHEPSVFAYEWVRCDSAGDNCLPIAGADQATYLVTEDDIDGRIGVTVTATNSIGSASADSGLTDVINQDPPPNDDIEDRQVLTGTVPIDVTGTNVNATRQPGEPDHLGFTEGASVWYEWTAPSGGGALDAVMISLAGSDYDTTLSVYEGTPTPFSGLDLVAENDDGGTGVQSEVAFAPEPDTTYYIAVDGFFDGSTVAMGTVRLEVDAASGIAGRLTDVNGDPAPGVCVDAFQDDSPVAFGTSDANGEYLVVGLPEGDYRLDFWDCDGRYIEEWYNDKPDYESADDVPVVDGAVTQDIDAVLARNGTISGRWTDDEGDPVHDESCGVYVYEAVTGDFVGSGFTDENGYYTVGWIVETGSYVAEASPCSGGYGAEWYDNELSQDDATPISVTFGADTGGIDFVLQDEVPVNTALPGISGSTVVGNTLTADPGSWDHEPSRYDHAWQRCDAAGDNCAPIGGATDPTYVVTGDDLGHRIRVSVVAVNSVGDSDPAVSAATGVVVELATAPGPRLLTPPVVTGEPDVGATLSASRGTWSGNPGSFVFQWRRCDTDGSDCDPITGADSDTYTTTDDDAGARLRVRVTATNGVGSGVGQSEATPVIGLPQVVDAPVISGLHDVGSVLSATTGTWTTTPTGYSHQWLRCDQDGAECTPIEGADGPDHTTTDDDRGFRLRVRITATNAAGSADSESAATRAIGSPRALRAPEVDGLLDVGRRLRATTGRWANDPTHHAYEWLRCDGATCSSIPDASRRKYRTTPDDLGFRLRVRVTASNDAGAGRKRSAATQPIGRPRNTTLPTIRGQAYVGRTLRARYGEWTGDPSFSTQWLRCAPSRGGCTPIPGADRRRYEVTRADRNDRLRVVVTATNGAGSATARSPATRRVTVEP